MREIYDGIIGLAIGDVLGVPVEFKSRAEIAENPVVSMREYGTHDQPLGTWSDDTSLTLALMDSMIQCREINDVDIMDRFSAWLLEGEYTATGEVFDVGNATCRAIMNYGRGISPIKCGGASEYENGNGSLMRILPLAYYIYSYKDLDLNGKIELIHKISSLTHQHIRSCIGCDIYLFVAMEMIERNGSLVQCIQNGVCTVFDFFCRCRQSEIEHYKRLKDIPQFKMLPEEQISSSGYIVHTLEAALWCLLNTESYEQCVLKAVNLGDDTDTVGAVAGGLAGIYYGADNIPKQWLEAVSKHDYIKGLCEQLQELLSTDHIYNGQR